MYYQSPIENSFYLVSIFLFYFSYCFRLFRDVLSLIWLIDTMLCSLTTNTQCNLMFMILIIDSLELPIVMLINKEWPTLKKDITKSLPKELHTLTTKKVNNLLLKTNKISGAKLKVKRESPITSASTLDQRPEIFQIILKLEDHLVPINERGLKFERILMCET